MANPSTQSGFLVLGDISGYTSFVATTELEHAEAVLSELLDLIVQNLSVVVTVNKLEGDAVFAHVADGQLPRDETLVEVLEATYAAFHDKVDAIRRRTTCVCNACRAIPTLDLKFVAHYGEYVAQRVRDGQELTGTSVTLAHRLLKNGMTEETGWRAYVMLSRAAVERLGLDTAALHERTDEYEFLGSVVTFSSNLAQRYTELVEARRSFITREEADFVHAYEVAAPAPVVWEWLNDPQRRNLYGGDVHWTAVSRLGGRTGAGARNHCAHGGKVSVETILDWRPFEYYTIETIGGGVPRKLETVQLTADESRTRVQHMLLVPMPMPRWLRRAICAIVFGRVIGYPALYGRMTRLIEEERRRPAEAADIEPAEALTTSAS